MMKAISMILLVSLALCDQSRFLGESMNSPFFEFFGGFAEAVGIENKLPNLLKCDPVNTETIKSAHNILEVLGGLKKSKNVTGEINQIINDFKAIHKDILERFSYCHEAFSHFVPIIKKAMEFIEKNQHKIILNFINNIPLIEEYTPNVREGLLSKNFSSVGYSFGKLYLVLATI